MSHFLNGNPSNYVIGSFKLVGCYVTESLRHGLVQTRSPLRHTLKIDFGDFRLSRHGLVSTCLLVYFVTLGVSSSDLVIALLQAQPRLCESIYYSAH